MTNIVEKHDWVTHSLCDAHQLWSSSWLWLYSLIWSHLISGQVCSLYTIPVHSHLPDLSDRSHWTRSQTKSLTDLSRFTQRPDACFHVWTWASKAGTRALSSVKIKVALCSKIKSIYNKGFMIWIRALIYDINYIILYYLVNLKPLTIYIYIYIYLYTFLYMYILRTLILKLFPFCSRY